MARQAFSHDLYTREPYLYLVYARTPGTASWSTGEKVSFDRAKIAAASAEARSIPRLRCRILQMLRRRAP